MRRYKTGKEYERRRVDSSGGKRKARRRQMSFRARWSPHGHSTGVRDLFLSFLMVLSRFFLVPRPSPTFFWGGKGTRGDSAVHEGKGSGGM